MGEQVVQFFLFESMGGNNVKVNPDTTVPQQVYDALINMVVNVAPLADSDIVYNATKRIRDEVARDILPLAGHRKYINYIDDVEPELTYYYSNEEIAALGEIQGGMDKLSCFKNTFDSNAGGRCVHFIQAALSFYSE